MDEPKEVGQFLVEVFGLILESMTLAKKVTMYVLITWFSQILNFLFAIVFPKKNVFLVQITIIVTCIFYSILILK